MYERFYNLRERPFSLSPDPDYLYPSRVHKEALSYLRYGIEGHAGFIVITGEIGSGKTTLLQTALRSLDRQTSVSRLVNTMLDARDLIEAVMLDFGMDPGHGRSKPHLLRDLARFLVDQRSAGRLALLVIDEAQNLSLAALEEVRMLSNLETEKSKLLQIALIGQPNLRDILGRPDLEQLRQRVTVSYHLNPLAPPETAAYINHRLKRAAIGAPLEFPRDVTDLIHQHSQGIPRKINVIADAVLLFGYGDERHAITVDLVHEVLEELSSTGVLAPSISRTDGRSVEAPTSVTSPDRPPISDQHYPRVPDPGVVARESSLAQRERQLAEQQRVLAEEYRLLRLRHEAAPPAMAAAPRAAVASATPVVAEPVRRSDWSQQPAARPQAPTAPTSAATAPRRIVMPPRPISPPVAAARNESVWSRFRRSLAGLAKPVFEDHGLRD